MDRGAWWSVVHGVTESWTWLKRLGTLAHIEGDAVNTENLGVGDGGVSACCFKSPLLDSDRPCPQHLFTYCP